jgi:ATP-dependent DNA helicase HFM1/MER3
LYLKGKIWILACTSTLAHGVNLPAHLVIIRGTSVYRGSHGYERLPRSMVTQMIGRAGRPGLDDHGIAVIMTSKEDKSYYEAVESNTEVVESNLMSMFVEVICAEMTSGVIEDIADAISWLRNTFFYIRVRKNPQHYGYESITSTEELEEKLKETCLK